MAHMQHAEPSNTHSHPHSSFFVREENALPFLKKQAKVEMLQTIQIFHLPSDSNISWNQQEERFSRQQNQHRSNLYADNCEMQQRICHVFVCLLIHILQSLVSIISTQAQSLYVVCKLALIYNSVSFKLGANLHHTMVYPNFIFSRTFVNWRFL